MENLEARISSLVGAPAGRAFLLLAARSGLAPVQIGMPRVSLEIAAAALGEVSRWRMDRHDVSPAARPSRPPRAPAWPRGPHSGGGHGLPPRRGSACSSRREA